MLLDTQVSSIKQCVKGSSSYFCEEVEEIDRIVRFVTNSYCLPSKSVNKLSLSTHSKAHGAAN